MSSKPKKEYTCDYGTCTCKYRTKYSLKRHYLSHMGVKQHQCPYCTKRFALTQYLQEHIYIHTGEKPFVCKHPGCGKKFRQAGKLSIHKKQHNMCDVPGNSSSQCSTNLGDANARTQLVQALLAQLAAFQFPSFFQSKTLPVPPQFAPKVPSL